MTQLALLAHKDLDAPIAYRRGRPISVRRFLADARALAQALPTTDHVINACADRYRFAVGFAACLISGRISLLPPSHMASLLEQLQAFAADAVVLADTKHRDLRLPIFPFPNLGEAIAADKDAHIEIPEIPAEQLATWVFTSGSTGRPQAHRKHWGLLRKNVANEARALGFTREDPVTLVGTVPPQHMYGFESTLLLAWLSGGSFDASRPFYPADIAETLTQCPANSMLVTTPFHLEKLLEANLRLPKIGSLLCATAPLSAGLARRAEAAFRAPLFEIYGSTETGQLATRRTSRKTAWTLFPEVRLQARDGQIWAEGGHVEGAVPLGDLVEQLDECRFRLKGRNTDRVNIAGKRTSLAWLNQQLLALPGVKDGCFYVPEQTEQTGESSVIRLTAFVVAPGLSAEHLMAALRQRIEPLFLPRPLILLDDLPRNAVGKLLRVECEALLAQHERDRDKGHGRLP
ncbi:acyl-CoA synthetase [Thiorhodococcus mannitoliphagus]|uniref:Acyl-CoA synthetase n=1 Tax=Thiorhodococcus mannitoliphagus TaxID=329406 RepID=A0A6P1DWB7_9GAMM|nr:AMP-binding protein [Thiorhodococcus mannitoliphagus]NEX21750.1 acyl-CoA synthetase [Thiorhodococcus mannitoliphagus]